MTTETTPKNETPSDRWNRRFEGIVRPYSQADVKRLRGSMHVKHTGAEDGARRLWDLMHELPYGARSPGTGWRRSWPAPRPASAGRSTPTSS